MCIRDSLTLLRLYIIVAQTNWANCDSAVLICTIFKYVPPSLLFEIWRGWRRPFSRALWIFGSKLVKFNFPQLDLTFSFSTVTSHPLREMRVGLGTSSPSHRKSLEFGNYSSKCKFNCTQLYLAVLNSKSARWCGWVPRTAYILLSGKESKVRLSTIEW